MKPLLFLSLGLLVYLPSFAQNSPTCDLPVCDIPAQISALEKNTQNERFVYVSNLEKTYRSTQDLATLQNLKAFGDAAMNLFIKLHEEDWLIRAAKLIRDEALIGIAKYQRPVSSPDLIQIYKDLGTQEPRFQILAYWTGIISTLDDTQLLGELITFAKEARAISQSSREEDYVMRQCNLIVSKASSRFAQVYPYHEGTYDVQLECHVEDGVPAPCNEAFLEMDRLALLDTQGGNGLIAKFSISQYEVLVLSYASVSFQGTELQGVTDTSERPSEFQATIDPLTGNIKGTISTSTSLGVNYNFTATPRRTGLMFKNGARFEASENIAGIYEGFLGSSRGTLVIKSFLNGTYRATWKSEELSGFQIDFQTEVTVAEKGLIALVAHPPGKSEMKLFLQKTPTLSGSVFWKGVYFIPNSGRDQLVILRKR